MEDLRLALFQIDPVWESAAETCKRSSVLVEKFFTGKKDSETPHIIMLPEFFSTGFTMNPAVAEDESGISARWMRETAAKYHTAVCGSIPIKSADKIYNRCHFITPDGVEYHYDKRHLFRMSDENIIYSPGSEKVIVEYLSWKISFIICYDLRFPVWARNNGMSYDLMLNMASWADSRINVTEYLAKARAIENMSYFAFVNRSGRNGDEIYSGHSRIIDPKGCDIAMEEDVDGVKVYTSSLSLSALKRFREKFPAWMDAD